MPFFRRPGNFAAILMVTLFGMMARAAPVSVDAIPVSEDYFLRTWDADDGLSNNQVFGLAQTPDGYLWIATGGGLARFDGVRFTTFLQDSTPGLESSSPMTLFVARDGALWIGLGRGGVARMSGGRFEPIVPCAPATVPSLTSSVAEDAEGAMWFGFYPDQKIVRWRDGTLSTFLGGNGVGPGGFSFVQADGSGKVWFTTKQGCGVFDGRRFLQIDPHDGVNPVIASAHGGGMWAARQGRILRYHVDGSVETVADFGDSQDVGVLFEDHAGDLWIGTRNAGLFRFRDGNFVRVPTSHTYISSIMEDREGNLWVGTSGGGINRLRPCRFSLRQERHGLRTDGVVSLCEDVEGRLWLAGSDGFPVRALDSSNRRFG
jgi:ligand-binding sensor domain-containing protein